MSLTPEKLILYSSKLFSSSDGRVHCRYQFMLQEQTLRRQSIRSYSTGQHHCTWHWQISLLFSWRNMINLAFINFHFSLSPFIIIRDCTDSSLVRDFATFHIFFDFDHTPDQVWFQFISIVVIFILENCRVKIFFSAAIECFPHNLLICIFFSSSYQFDNGYWRNAVILLLLAFTNRLLIRHILNLRFGNNY